MRSTLFAAFAILALLLADCLGGRTEKIKAVVIGREYIPAHTTWSTDSKGRTTSHFTAPKYSLIVAAENKTRKIDTNQNGYYLTQEGGVITYSQRRGCFSHHAWMASYYP
jgi:hypothetical protein